MAKNDLSSIFDVSSVNTEYILNYPSIASIEQRDLKLLPSTYVMYWCLLATEFYRIFTIEDLREFLFRLPIVLHRMHLLDNWFGYDQLMNYKVEDQPYTFTVKDIFGHFGIEHMDAVFNYFPREEFFKRVNDDINFARLMALINHFEVIPTAKTGEEIRQLPEDRVAPGITDEVIKNAEFFAEDVMKLAPEGLFADRGRFAQKEADLEKRREAMARIPQFDLSKIPDDIVEQCIAHIFDAEWVEEMKKEDPEGFRKETEKYIYLAWLFANHYLVHRDGHTYAHEGIEINPGDYVTEDIKGDLYMIYLYNGMEELEPLLKGLLHE